MASLIFIITVFVTYFVITEVGSLFIFGFLTDLDQVTEQMRFTRYRTDSSSQFTIVTAEPDGEWTFNDNYYCVSTIPFSLFAKYYVLKGQGAPRGYTIPRWSKLHKRLEEYNNA